MFRLRAPQVGGVVGVRQGRESSFQPLVCARRFVLRSLLRDIAPLHHFFSHKDAWRRQSCGKFGRRESPISFASARSPLLCVAIGIHDALLARLRGFDGGQNFLDLFRNLINLNGGFLVFSSLLLCAIRVIRRPIDLNSGLVDIGIRLFCVFDSLLQSR